VILPALVLALATDLRILSVKPSMEVVHTDETFSFTVDVRNEGPDAAPDVSVKAGANALSLLLGVDAPKGWTCDLPSPHFGYVVTCTTPSLAAKETAQFTVHLAASQPFAMTYRIGAAVGTKTLEKNLSLVSAKTHAELSMTSRDLDFDIRNDGPADAQSLTAIFTGAKDATGKGWQCKANSESVICTRDALKVGETTSVTVHGDGKIDARVRAEQFWDANPRDNGVKRKAIQ
jgi:hypothetical protein